MKNTFNKIFIIVFLAMNYNSQAQKIKFPESFRGDASLFKGMKFAEIPLEAQTKYDIHKNPGLISDVSKTRGFLMSGKIKNIKAVYFEIYKNLEEEEKMSCGFEVAQFDSVDEMEKILPKTDVQSESVILLTLENYLIMVYGPPSNNVGKRLDDMSNYFQKKLGAKLIRDRKREVETAITEDYVSNLPPPLPPEPEANYTEIAIEELDNRIANTDGFAYMRTKKREKLAPGKYLATSTHPAFETLSFTLNKDGLLNGDYEYHYAESYSKSPSKESKLTYDNGVLVSEIVYEKGKLLGSTTHTFIVIKEGKYFSITRNTITKSPAYGDIEIVTVFRNRKPISKTTTRLGVSVIKKDFEKNILEQYDNLGRLQKLQKPELTEEYNNAGDITYKEEWIDGNQFIYKNGKLRHKQILIKNKDQYLVTEYDADGKVLNEVYKGFENHAIVSNPDEYEDEMNEAMFEYYKKKTK